MRGPTKKMRALQQATGKSWERVAADWKESAKSQAEIAIQWTALVQVICPGMRFNQAEVGRIMRRAATANAPAA